MQKGDQLDHILLDMFQNKVKCKNAVSKGWCKESNQFFYNYLSLVLKKPVFGVSDEVPHKPGSTTTQDG